MPNGGGKRSNHKENGKSSSKKVRPFGDLDPRFIFSDPSYDWGKELDNQMLWGTAMKVLLPDEKGVVDSTKAEFVIPAYEALLPGLKTRFYIEGTFTKFVENNWVPVTPEDAGEVMLTQNWFEKRISRVSVYCGSNYVSRLVNKEVDCSAAYINMLAYAHMDPELKKLVCMEPAHTGNACTLLKKDWDFEGAAWKKYAPSICNGGKFLFSWIPLNTWPFYQSGDYTLGNNPPRAVPTSLLKDLVIAIHWTDNEDDIIIKKEGNTTIYTLQFEVKLAIEVAIVNPRMDMDKKLPSRLTYLGQSRKGDVAIIEGVQLTLKFEHVKLPSSILLFVVSKSALRTYKPTAEDAKEEFLKHNIEYVRVAFNEVEYFDSKRPEKFSKLPLSVPLILQTHLDYPIMGIPVDRMKTTLDILQDDGTNYAFPHLYYRLSPGYNQHLLPVRGSIAQLQKEGNLTMVVRFEDSEQMPKNSVLVYYLLYEDEVALSVDVQKKVFHNRYNIA